MSCLIDNHPIEYRLVYYAEGEIGNDEAYWAREEIPCKLCAAARKDLESFCKEHPEACAQESS